MKVILFDMRDAKEPGDRQIMLRLVDDCGILRAQFPVYGDERFAEDLADGIATHYHTEFQWVGPAPVVSEQGTGSGERLSERSSEAETDFSVDRALRWCPHCSTSTQQDRLSDVSWMCGDCCRVLAESTAAKTPVATTDPKPRRQKVAELKQLSMF